MTKRDPIKEVTDVKARAKKAPPENSRLRDLRSLWKKTQDAEFEGVADFFIMRAVTLVEVFARRWIERLIDHGDPYIERAGRLLQSGVKYDFAITMAIEGKRVSLAQLVAHTLKTNQFDQVCAYFDALLEHDLFQLLKNAKESSYGAQGKVIKTPIIQDADRVRSDLARLFTIRHILTHESPARAPYVSEDIDGSRLSLPVYARHRLRCPRPNLP